VKLNQIQVIGTHNSYHAGLAPSEAKLLEQKNRNCTKHWSIGIGRWMRSSPQACARSNWISMPTARAGAMRIQRYRCGGGGGLPKDPDFDPRA